MKVSNICLITIYTITTTMAFFQGETKVHASSINTDTARESFGNKSEVFFENDHASNPKSEAHGLARRRYSSASEVLTLEDRFDKFLLLLGTFVNDFSFQCWHFENDRAKLTEDFKEIVSAFQSIAPKPKTVIEKFKHCHTVFETMIEAAHHIFNSANYGNPCYFIISEIYELRLNAFRLFDSKGVPDPQVESYFEKVTSLISRLNQICNMAKSVTSDEHPHLLQIMWNQISRAEKTVKLLASKLLAV
ncbi:hypothetical protein JCM33374_g4413 [Metschnikowia sp. JCM 33374]|nr:hypothetical protein JCM33374_g4413 [Metschnikowia sp. JCM 33374]